MSADTGNVQACFAHCAPGDSLVLLNTAVNVLLDQHWNQALDAGVDVYVLTEDASAQGFTQSSSAWEYIDDAAWVKLFLRHRHCLSWK